MGTGLYKGGSGWRAGLDSLYSSVFSTLANLYSNSSTLPKERLSVWI